MRCQHVRADFIEADRISAGSAQELRRIDGGAWRSVGTCSAIALVCSHCHRHSLGPLPASEIGGTSLLRGLDHTDRCTAHLSGTASFIEKHRGESCSLLVLEACYGSGARANRQQRIECSDPARCMCADGLRFGCGCECRLLHQGGHGTGEFVALRSTQQIPLGRVYRLERADCGY